MSLKNNTEYVQSLIEDKCDPVLGQKVFMKLRDLGLEQVNPHTYDPREAVDALVTGVQKALEHLGLDPADPSTQDTPRRYACMVVGELTKGLNYDFFPKCTATPNGERKTEFYQFEGPYSNESGTREVSVGAYNQMVLVRDIQTMSLCEHHLQTIDGVTHIAYIPSTKVLGLSKFARVTEFFARRPQIQERMTEQIFEALKLILDTEDIAIVQDATHYCMRARGAMQHSSRTQTDKMGGRFMQNPALRQEFFDAVRK